MPGRARCGAADRGVAASALSLVAASTEDAPRQRPSPTESGLSVAVLLFTNQSGDAAQDYFADGLTEDITRALGRFKQLTVHRLRRRAALSRQAAAADGDRAVR